MPLMCIVPVAPLRLEPSHRSEMVSQLLFGEIGDLLDSAQDFVKIKTRFDGYEGWCQQSQLVNYEKNDHWGNAGYVDTPTAVIFINNIPCLIPYGAELQSNIEGNQRIGTFNIKFEIGLVSGESRHFDSKKLLDHAKHFLGTAYLWGGKSIWGVDCSGLVQQLYKLQGIALPRDAYQQAGIGESVGFLQETKPGDLAFFDNDESRITHVGILLNDHEVLHASGNVHIDRIDHAGIIHSITGKRTHRLRLIKRVSNTV